MPRKKSAESKPPKSIDDKAATFVRLAEQRTGKALKAISQLQHLANPAAYVYTEDQAMRIYNALRVAVDAVQESFHNPKAAKASGFKL